MSLRRPTSPAWRLVNSGFALDRAEAVATVAHHSGEPLTPERTDRVELGHSTAPDHPVPTEATPTPNRTPQVIHRTGREAGGTYPIDEADAILFSGATTEDTLEVWWFATASRRDGVRLEAATLSTV